LGGAAIDEIAHADQVPADTPTNRRPYLREFDIELCGVDHGPCRLHGFLPLALVGGARIHLFLRNGARAHQHLRPRQIFVHTLKLGIGQG
jgi:hypothetical protein